MKIVKRPDIMQRIAGRLKRRGKSIGFVPTMGALHEGHLSLIRRARRANDILVVSIFVNPLQFGPSEDLKRYPRPFEKDKKLCRKEGVDFIFYPGAESLYPRDFKTRIAVNDLEDVLCGKSRPGHFRGVATVVAKLFNIVQPDTAYFGQKDAQQAVIIRRMARDLNMPLNIAVMPVVREKDGLAMSSRNVYLDADERRDAAVLPQALKLAEGLVKKNVRDSAKIVSKMKELIQQRKTASVDYISVVDPDGLLPVRRINPCSRALIALAVRIGRTRLIDNIMVGNKGR
ncbi:MAG: pantoate--beta-alanine ligase [Candidatus Omnitrophica bacterium]|nr:pantoate--beta-alanine ligase [Candidatus Omnitrophota bacterium]